MSQPAAEPAFLGPMTETTAKPEALITNPDVHSDARMRELVELLATAAVRLLGGEIPTKEGEPQP